MFQFTLESIYLQLKVPELLLRRQLHKLSNKTASLCYSNERLRIVRFTVHPVHSATMNPQQHHDLSCCLTMLVELYKLVNDLAEIFSSISIPKIIGDTFADNLRCCKLY